MFHRQRGEIPNVGVEADSPRCWTQFKAPSYRYLSVWADWNIHPFFGGQKQMGCRNSALCNSTAHCLFIFMFFTSSCGERAAYKLIWCRRWQWLTAPPPHCCCFFPPLNPHPLLTCSPSDTGIIIKTAFSTSQLSLSHGQTTTSKGLPPLTQIQSTWFIWKKWHLFHHLIPIYHSQGRWRCQILIRRSKIKSFVHHTFLKIVKHLGLLLWISPSQFTVQLAEADVSSRHTNTTSQSARSDVPQCADEAIRGSLCIQGADVPNVQEAGHLIRHGGRSREERLQQDRMRFITVQWSVEMFPNYGKCHCFWDGCVDLL